MEFLTVKETAQLLRVSPITVRRYIASGQLAAERVGRGIRVRREAIEEFVTPVVPVSEQWDAESEDLPTLREQLGNIIGIGRSGKPSNVSEHKYEYLAEVYSDVVDDEADGLGQDELLDRPFTMDDPLSEIVGIGRSGGPNDVASNKHKYLAEAIVASGSEDTGGDDERPMPRTILEGLGISAGIGRSGERTDIAEHKDEYLADAFDPKG